MRAVVHLSWKGPDMVADRHPVDEYEFDPDESPGIEFVSVEEGRRIFDHRARMELGISGEEFLRRWDAGEYPYPIPDDTEGRKIARLTMMMPIAGRSIS